MLDEDDRRDPVADAVPVAVAGPAAGPGLIRRRQRAAPPGFARRAVRRLRIGDGGRVDPPPARYCSDKIRVIVSGLIGASGDPLSGGPDCVRRSGLTQLAARAGQGKCPPLARSQGGTGYATC